MTLCQLAQKALVNSFEDTTFLEGSGLAWIHMLPRYTLQYRGVKYNCTDILTEVQSKMKKFLINLKTKIPTILGAPESDCTYHGWAYMSSYQQCFFWDLDRLDHIYAVVSHMVQPNQDDDFDSDSDTTFAVEHGSDSDTSSYDPFANSNSHSNGDTETVTNLYAEINTDINIVDVTPKLRAITPRDLARFNDHAPFVRSEVIPQKKDDDEDWWSFAADPIGRKAQFLVPVDGKYVLIMVWYKDYQLSCTHGDDLYIFVVMDDAPIWHEEWIRTLESLLLKLLMRKPSSKRFPSKKWTKYHLY